jgi:hypothetical protein
VNRDSDADDLRPRSFEEEEAADLRKQFVRSGVRLALLFAVLVTGVYFAFWWSGSAIRFGAARAADRSVPTWQVSGTVRDASTRAGIAWARIEDDPRGNPPFFRADSDQHGVFTLQTLAEPHQVRVTAPGYRLSVVEVGRVWFLWMPRGRENRDVLLVPE